MRLQCIFASGICLVYAVLCTFGCGVICHFFTTSVFAEQLSFLAICLSVTVWFCIKTIYCIPSNIQMFFFCHFVCLVIHAFWHEYQKISISVITVWGHEGMCIITSDTFYSNILWLFSMGQLQLFMTTVLRARDGTGSGFLAHDLTRPGQKQ